MIWYIWWLAALSFVAVLADAIGHTFNYHRDFHIPADEVARTEDRAHPPARSAGLRHMTLGSTLTADTYTVERRPDAASKHRCSTFIDEHEHAEGCSTMLGFWIYLMSDCLIFAVLFATYGVLGGNYAAGPSPRDLFELPLVAVNTSMLLLSSITYGFAMLAMQKDNMPAHTALAGRHRPLRRSLHRHRAATNSPT